MSVIEGYWASAVGCSALFVCSFRALTDTWVPWGSSQVLCSSCLFFTGLKGYWHSRSRVLSVLFVCSVQASRNTGAPELSGIFCSFCPFFVEPPAVRYCLFFLSLFRASRDTGGPAVGYCPFLCQFFWGPERYWGPSCWVLSVFYLSFSGLEGYQGSGCRVSSVFVLSVSSSVLVGRRRKEGKNKEENNNGKSKSNNRNPGG